MSGEERLAPTDELRERAVSRLKKKSDFHAHLMIYVLVNTVLTVAFAMADAGFFVPVLVMAAWGIGLVANAREAYGRDVPTESQIRQEMEKLSRDR
jgi:2TM domain